MLFAGYLVYLGRFTLQRGRPAGAVGCIGGSVPAYYLGQYGGRPLIERYGKYVLLSHHEPDLADRLFARHGTMAVPAARLLPVSDLHRVPRGRRANEHERFIVVHVRRLVPDGAMRSPGRG